MYLLLAAALLPAIALMVYVYGKDKSDKEPAGLVVRVFILGAISGPVAAVIENVLFSLFETVIPGGLTLVVVEYFIGVAAVEEACKYFCLNTVRKHPAFDYVFDAIVYSVAAALGFAALENILYVFDGGLEVAFTRAIFSVPGHMADGVVMGVFFGLARKRELHGNKPGARLFYVLAYILPVIEHGFYDTALSLDSDFMAGLAMLFDLAFIAVAFVLVRNISKNDTPLKPPAPAPVWPPVTSYYQQPTQQPQAQQPYQQSTVQQPYQQPAQQSYPQPDQQPYQQYYQQPAVQQPDAQASTWPSGQQPAASPAQSQDHIVSPEPSARYSSGPTVRYSSQSGNSGRPRNTR